MVSMNLVERVLYSELKDFVKTELPKIKNNKKTWKAFLKYSEFQGRWFGDTLAAWALGWGSNPRIGAKDLDGAFGLFNGPKEADVIYVDKDLAVRFKKDSKKPAAKLLMEATILHEMVHWGDHKDGKDQPPEEGDEFEKAAYGKIIGKYW